jgi:hypothetical protein
LQIGWRSGEPLLYIRGWLSAQKWFITSLLDGSAVWFFSSREAGLAKRLLRLALRTGSIRFLGLGLEMMMAGRA